MTRSLILGCSLTLLACWGLRAGDLEVNPEHERWSGFKAGSFVTHHIVTEVSGTRTEMITTTKLVEVDAERLVFEVVTVMRLGGSELNLPPQRRVVPARIERPPASRDDAGTTAAQPLGEELVKVSGETYPCQVSERQTEAKGVQTRTRSWRSPKVPGELVKSRSISTGSLTAETSARLTAFKAVH